MSSTLSGQWLWIPARQCSVTRRKSDATVSTAEHPRLHSCWWMGIIFSRSQSFRLLHLGVSCRIWCTKADDVRLQNCKSTGPERGNQKQMEEGHHWDSSKMRHTIQKRLTVVRKQNLGAIQHIFPPIAVTGYRSRAVRRVEVIGYFVLFRHPILLRIWWDWPLTSLTNHHPSVLWHCWLGHLARKIVSEMTYNVSSGT